MQAAYPHLFCLFSLYQTAIHRVQFFQFWLAETIQSGVKLGPERTHASIAFENLQRSL